MKSAAPKILIIPGLGENGSLRDYQKIRRCCERAVPGAKVVFHVPHWDRRTAADWIDGATKAIERLGPSNTYVIGFSLGAYVGLFLSERFQILGASLCSMSPFFAEEMKAVPDSTRKFFGVRRVRDFSERAAPRELKIRPSFFFGDLDWVLGVQVARQLAKRYRGKFQTIHGADHGFTPPYIDALVATVKAQLR